MLLGVCALQLLMYDLQVVDGAAWMYVPPLVQRDKVSMLSCPACLATLCRAVMAAWALRQPADSWHVQVTKSSRDIEAASRKTGLAAKSKL